MSVSAGGVGLGARPLLYPVAAWAAPPAHSITCIAVSEGRQLEAGAEEHAQKDDTFAAARYGRSVVSGSISGELVQWEEDDEQHAAAASVFPLRPRLRPRALLFHAGASSCTALTPATLGCTRVFVAASSEGFLSCWSEGGSRCRRSALVLPFAATVLRPVYAYSTSPAALQPLSPRAPAMAGTIFVLSSSLPADLTPATRPAHTYIVCADTTGGSGLVLLVRMPRFRVVSILQHAAPLAAVELSHAPHSVTLTALESAAQGEAPPAHTGPTLVTLTVDGKISVWRLSDFLPVPRKAAATGFAASPAAARAHISSLAHADVAESSSLAHPRHVSENGKDSAAEDELLSAFRADGVRISSTPERVIALPMPNQHNLQPNDPLIEVLVQAEPRWQASAAMDAAAAHLPMSFHPTACALSNRSQHLLVTSGAHLLLLSMQHWHLELPIQSMDLLLRQARSQELRHALEAGEEATHVIPPWSPTDSLIGCAFMSDDLQRGSEKRVCVWSAEGGVWVLLLHTEPAPVPIVLPDSATQVPAVSARAILPPAVSCLTPDSVVHANPPLAMSVFALCHHVSPASSTACSTSERSRPSVVLEDFSRSQSAVVAAPMPAQAASLSKPMTVTVNEQRVLCGNADGQLSQFFIPRASAVQASTQASSSVAPSHPGEWNAHSRVWHLQPTQIVAVADAFGSSAAGAASENREDRRHGDDAIPSAPPALSQGLSRPASYDGVTRRTSISGRADERASHGAEVHSAAAAATPSARRRSVSELGHWSSPPGLPIDESTNACTSSCMLVDSVRMQVLLARGFESGHLQLLNIVGPVHGQLSSHFVPTISGSGPAALQAHVHTAAITCMASVSKHALTGEGVRVLLITGGADGQACVWEAHSGLLLHVFRCAAPIVSLQQPLSIPTISSLVQAQQAGLLSPSPSDCAASTAVLPVASNGSDLDAYLSVSRALDCDVVCQTPSPDLLFIVCADHTVYSALVQAHPNDFIMSHFSASPFVPASSPAQQSALCNRFLQVFRGHHAPVQAVFFNAAMAQHDLLVTRDTAGCLYVFNASSGALEQCVDHPPEVQATLQMFDLVSSGSQLSVMAYQLRQIRAFAPGLFQMPQTTTPELSTDSRLQTQTAPAPLASKSPAPSPLNTMKRAITNIRRLSAFKPSARAGSLPPQVSASVQLARSSGVDPSSQQHLLCTYLLNRFLFHLQQPGFSASVLHGLHRGASLSASQAVQSHMGMAALVYRPSMLQRGSGGAHAVRAMTLHGNAADSVHRRHALSLSVFALDIEELSRELSSRYAALASTAAPVVGAGAASASALYRAAAHDAKRDAQAAWHTLLGSLWDWDADGLDVSSILQRHLHSSPPPAQQTFAVMSDRAQALCVLFPSHARAQRRWRMDGECTAQHQLAIQSVLHMLLQTSEVSLRAHWTRLQQYYSSQLAQQLSGYQEADVAYLALYSLHTQDNIQQSARALLQSVVERASEEQRRTMWREWAAPYNTPAYTQNATSLLVCNLFSLRLLRREETSSVLAAAASPAAGSPTSESHSISARGSAESSPPARHKPNALSMFTGNNSPGSLLSKGKAMFARVNTSRGMTPSASTDNLHAAGASGSDSPSRSGPSASPSASASPPAASSPAPARRAGHMPSSSSSSLLSASVPLLPEYVSDKEMMGALVLCSIFIAETNSVRMRARDMQIADMRASSSEAGEPSRGAKGASAGAQSASAASGAAFGASSSLLSECDSKMPFVVHTLLRMLAWQSHAPDSIQQPCELVKLALACDLLARGFTLFRAAIPADSLPLLLRRLQYLNMHSSLIEKASQHAHGASILQASSSAQMPPALLLSLHAQLYSSSRALLLEVGRHAAGMYLFIIGKEMLLQHVTALLPVERSLYLLSIVSLLRKYPRAASPSLLDAVHTLLKLLHPHTAGVRASLLSQCVEVMHSLALIYPQCAVHLETGKVAVGTGAYTYHMVGNKSSSTAARSSSSKSGLSSPASGSVSSPAAVGVSSSMDSSLLVGQSGQSYRPQRSATPNVILVFDLRTAGKWRVLEGHAAAVTALCFHPSGSHVASYSARDTPQPTLRVWKLGEAGFMADLMHTHGKCVRNIPLTDIDPRTLVARERHEQTRQRSDALARAYERNSRLPAGHEKAAGVPIRDVSTHATGDAHASSGAIDSAAAAPLSSLPAAAAAAASPASSVRVLEEDEDDASVLQGRMLAVRLRWQGDSLSLTREDGSTVTFACKV